MYPSEKYQRVMVVDDEEGVRVSCDRFLSARGFDVTTVETGEGAINRLRDEPVDVVVSDLRMPGLDGLQLLEWVHERQPETRFILLTGYGSEEVERKARALGAFGYLNKPISPDALSALITAASQLHKQEQARAAVVEAAAVPEVVEVAPLEMATSPEAETAPQGAARSAAEVIGGLSLAPLLGLAFVIFLPVIGIGALLWVVGEAIWKRAAPARA
jgi:DNA-binding NtrC family response regulator